MTTCLDDTNTLLLLLLLLLELGIVHTSIAGCRRTQA